MHSHHDVRIICVSNTNDAIERHLTITKGYIHHLLGTIVEDTSSIDFRNGTGRECDHV